MKKTLIALLALSAVSFGFAADPAPTPDKAKATDKDCSACCCKDATACTAAKDGKTADVKKDAKDAAPTDKK